MPSDSVFTPEQIGRVREIARGEALVAVASGAGDTPRLLRRFVRIVREYELGTAAEMSPLDRLAYLSALCLDQANADRGVRTDFAVSFERTGD